MKKILFFVLVLMVSFAANAQNPTRTKASKTQTTTKTQTTSKTKATPKVQLTKGQYLACTQDGVALRTSPSDSSPKIKQYGLTVVLLGPGNVELSYDEYFFMDLGFKYLGKKENGYLYVEAIHDGDIFDNVVIKGWVPEKYVKAACKKCNGLGNVDYEMCTSCKGRGY